MVTALLAGSFDPITLGHLELIKESSAIFKRLVIGIGVNPEKKYLFSFEKRAELVKRSLEEAHIGEIDVVEVKGLTTNFARSIGAQVLIRGIRQASDMAYEWQLSAINKKLAPEIKTIFITVTPAVSMICSTFVKEIAHYGGDLSLVVPKCVLEAFEEVIW